MAPKKTGEWIETETGNKISRRAQIHGPTNIILTGKSLISPDVILRGDLVRTLPPSSAPGPGGAPAKPTSHVAIATGRYVHLAQGAVLHPPSRLHRGVFSHHPLKIGDNVYVGHHTVVQAASIGSNVWIGDNVVLGNLCTVKDCVKILTDTVVPDGMTIPNNWIVAGRPARWVGDVGVGWDGPDKNNPAQL